MRSLRATGSGPRGTLRSQEFQRLWTPSAWQRKFAGPLSTLVERGFAEFDCQPLSQAVPEVCNANNQHNLGMELTTRETPPFSKRCNAAPNTQKYDNYASPGVHPLH